MIDRSKALQNIPQGLRDELFTEFDKITKNYRENHWEASELDGGRFSEVVYAILDGYGSGTYPASATKPSNMKRSCESLEQLATTFPRSVRITIPRILVALYEVRNNRGVGHVGGDVDSNHMDAEYVLHSAQWVMAELVRIFHGLTVAEATATVDALVERTTPLIWEVGGKKRILKTEMSLADKTLVLLYSTTGPVQDKVLGDWLELEKQKLSNYKARVLKALHAKKWIEYAADGSVRLSPLGTAEVETSLL
ncbi:hypothetical protein [Mycobacterium colombiense]|uniref:hypothetical protein n=1 Tax=Mycobacterium colombiense TaxID=339268 RepID=UPI00096D83CA|nr:hypothetical protein [Mycobacterium colombiense]OMB95994.1 hypothetical protein A5732_10305 [Mycobacterium colombiense]